MQYRNSTELFALVKGMNKWEKKRFHLYARRNVNHSDLKVLAVYNAINAMERYDEKVLIQRLNRIEPMQVSSLKVSLYNLLLDSLRVMNKKESVGLQLRQLLDHASILSERGFYTQALKALARAKVLAKRYQQYSFCYQIVVMEYTIEMSHGQHAPEQIQMFVKEMQQYSEALSLIGMISNQCLLLYDWYKRFGVVRKEADNKVVDDLFAAVNPAEVNGDSFYASLYYLQLSAYYCLTKEDVNGFAKAAHGWVTLFDENLHMKDAERLQYERGLVYLSEAALLVKDTRVLAMAADGLQVSGDVFYRLLAELNVCLCGDCGNPGVIERAFALIEMTPLEERVIVICEKAARLCLTWGRADMAVDFANRGMGTKCNARMDLQYNLRCLHVEAHRMLGNEELAEYLERSVRRFGREIGV